MAYNVGRSGTYPEYQPFRNVFCGFPYTVTAKASSQFITDNRVLIRCYIAAVAEISVIK
jgi:hypothetical protein